MIPKTFEEFYADPQATKPVLKYDSALEPKPDHPWFRLRHDEIDRLLKVITHEVKKAVKDMPDTDKELKTIATTAFNIEYVPNERPLKVGVIGAQGAGKSLFFNALLDTDGLSHTGADGAACTSAVVRYARLPVAEDSDGDSKFRAEVEFLDPRQRDEMIMEHVRNFLHYQDEFQAGTEDDSLRNQSDHQDELDRRLKDTAEDFFVISFGSRDFFHESRSTNASRTEDFARLCLMQGEEMIKRLKINGRNVKTFVAKDQHEMLRKIKSYLTDAKGKASLWPLVATNTVSFDHPLLQLGLEFFDIPGTGDINLSRARLADSMKDSLDVEIIVADTIRITTDPVPLQAARAAIMHRGPSAVKTVATKIDALSDNQIAQCTGDGYDHIKTQIQKAQEEALQAEEEGDEIKLTKYEKYKTYLERSLKIMKIGDTADDVSSKMTTSLRKYYPDIPAIYHTSAADYMKWIAKEKILFKDRPALSPEDTGIPALRKFLIGLPADRNLACYVTHLQTTVPEFLEKIRRVVTPTDRDEGFSTIAEVFDRETGYFIRQISQQAKSTVQLLLRRNLSLTRKDIVDCKQRVEREVRAKWLTLKPSSFQSIVKHKGLIPKGKSRVPALSAGCNWNVDIASILKPVFDGFHRAHTELMNFWKVLVLEVFNDHFKAINHTINNSAANLNIVEQSKGRWIQIRNVWKSKLLGLIEQLIAEELLSFNDAVSTLERENKLIASVTDDLYDQVFLAAPALKDTSPGKPKQYASPKGKFQKEHLEKLFFQKEHIVDKVLRQFVRKLEFALTKLIEVVFQEIDQVFTNYSNWLKEHAPIG